MSVESFVHVAFYAQSNEIREIFEDAIPHPSTWKQLMDWMRDNGFGDLDVLQTWFDTLYDHFTQVTGSPVIPKQRLYSFPLANIEAANFDVVNDKVLELRPLSSLCGIWKTVVELLDEHPSLRLNRTIFQQFLQAGRVAAISTVIAAQNKGSIKQAAADGYKVWWDDRNDDVIVPARLQNESALRFMRSVENVLPFLFCACETEQLLEMSDITIMTRAPIQATTAREFVAALHTRHPRLNLINANYAMGASAFNTGYRDEASALRYILEHYGPNGDRAGRGVNQLSQADVQYLNQQVEHEPPRRTMKSYYPAEWPPHAQNVADELLSMGSFERDDIVRVVNANPRSIPLQDAEVQLRITSQTLSTAAPAPPIRPVAPAPTPTLTPTPTPIPPAAPRQTATASSPESLDFQRHGRFEDYFRNNADAILRVLDGDTHPTDGVCHPNRTVTAMTDWNSSIDRLSTVNPISPASTMQERADSYAGGASKAYYQHLATRTTRLNSTDFQLGIIPPILGYRNVAGDGHCTYRALYAGIIEHCITKPATEPLKRIALRFVHDKLSAFLTDRDRPALAREFNNIDTQRPLEDIVNPRMDELIVVSMRNAIATLMRMFAFRSMNQFLLRRIERTASGEAALLPECVMDRRRRDLHDVAREIRTMVQRENIDTPDTPDPRFVADVGSDYTLNITRGTSPTVGVVVGSIRTRTLVVVEILGPRRIRTRPRFQVNIRGTNFQLIAGNIPPVGATIENPALERLTVANHVDGKNFTVRETAHIAPGNEIDFDVVNPPAFAAIGNVDFQFYGGRLLGENIARSIVQDMLNLAPTINIEEPIGLTPQQRADFSMNFVENMIRSQVLDMGQMLRSQTSLQLIMITFGLQVFVVSTENISSPVHQGTSFYVYPQLPWQYRMSAADNTFLEENLDCGIIPIRGHTDMIYIHNPRTTPTRHPTAAPPLRPLQPATTTQPIPSFSSAAAPPLRPLPSSSAAAAAAPPLRPLPSSSAAAAAAPPLRPLPSSSAAAAPPLRPLPSSSAAAAPPLRPLSSSSAAAAAAAPLRPLPSSSTAATARTASAGAASFEEPHQTPQQVLADMTAAGYVINHSLRTLIDMGFQQRAIRNAIINGVSLEDMIEQALTTPDLGGGKYRRSLSGAARIKRP